MEESEEKNQIIDDELNTEILNKLVIDDKIKTQYIKSKRDAKKSSSLNIFKNLTNSNVTYMSYKGDEFKKAIKKLKNIERLKNGVLKNCSYETKISYFRDKNKNSYYSNLLKSYNILEINLNNEDKTQTIFNVQSAESQLKELLKTSEYINKNIGSDGQQLLDEESFELIQYEEPKKEQNIEILLDYVPKEKVNDIIQSYETYIEKLNYNYNMKLSALKSEIEHIHDKTSLDYINKTIEYTRIDDFNTFLEDPHTIIPYLKPSLNSHIDFKNCSMVPTDDNYIENIVDELSLPALTSIGEYILKHDIYSYIFKQEFKDFAEFVVTDILKNVLILIDKKKFTFLYNYQNDTYKSIDLITLSNEILYGTEKRIKEHVY